MDDNEFHDVAEPSDGPTTPPVQPGRTQREGVPWAAILVAVRFAWMVVFPLLFLLRFERGLGARGGRRR